MEQFGGVPGKYAAVRAKKEKAKQKNALKRQMAQLGYHVPKKSSDSGLSSITDLFGKVKLKAMRTKKPDVDPKNIVEGKRSRKDIVMKDEVPKGSRVQTGRASAKKVTTARKTTTQGRRSSSVSGVASTSSKRIPNVIKGPLTKTEMKNLKSLVKANVEKLVKMPEQTMIPVHLRSKIMQINGYVNRDPTLIKYSKMPVSFYNLDKETTVINKELFINEFMDILEKQHIDNSRKGISQREAMQLYSQSQMVNTSLSNMFARM
jgi:hypothetical protein